MCQAVTGRGKPAGQVEPYGQSPWGCFLQHWSIKERKHERLWTTLPCRSEGRVKGDFRVGGSHDQHSGLGGWIIPAYMFPHYNYIISLHHKDWMNSSKIKREEGEQTCHYALNILHLLALVHFYEILFLINKFNKYSLFVAKYPAAMWDDSSFHVQAKQIHTSNWW